MQVLALRGDTPLRVRGRTVPAVRVRTVNALRVWADRRGKTHFVFERAQPTRAPARCAHVGTFRVNGRMTPYTWSRGVMGEFRCGDCGAALT